MKQILCLIHQFSSFLLLFRSQFFINFLSQLSPQDVTLAVNVSENHRLALGRLLFLTISRSHYMLIGHISGIGGDGGGIIKAAEQLFESVLVALKPGGF